MIEEVKKILESSKKAYRESILIENKIIEDELFTIISSATYLLNNIERYNFTREKKKKYNPRSESEEIERVSRKIRLWRDKEYQDNHKILKAYMVLSDNNSHPVDVNELEKKTGINDSKKFIGSYNGMKLIAEKNHGKVFSELDGKVTLWEPVANIVIKEFNV